jgi:hypothetical protein
MRLPSDKAVVRVAKAWGNRVAPLLRFIGRSLFVTAIVFAVAYHGFWRFFHHLPLDQTEVWGILRFMAHTAAALAGTSFLTCVIAVFVTPDPRIRKARPVGWIVCFVWVMAIIYSLEPGIRH